MKVKLCSRCPYTPPDLAGHYAPEGLLHACAKCDGQGASTNHYRRKARRRQQYATVPNIPVTAQPSVARFATDNLASYATTPGEPPSVRRNAPTASRHARKATADGCVGLVPPDSDCGEALAALFRSPVLLIEEPAQ
jgi:hypothetical protein